MTILLAKCWEVFMILMNLLNYSLVHVIKLTINPNCWTPIPYPNYTFLVSFLSRPRSFSRHFIMRGTLYEDFELEVWTSRTEMWLNSTSKKKKKKSYMYTQKSYSTPSSEVKGNIGKIRFILWLIERKNKKY